MIYIGFSDCEKESVIRQYCQTNDTQKIVVVSPKQFPFSMEDADLVDFDDTIEYATFYRLLQEIDNSTLVVLSECLRKQNRYDLTYNCIRHFLNQTRHQIIFQRFPQIDTREDFMILFDFDTQSRWKRQKFDINLILDNSNVLVNPRPFSFRRIDVPTTLQTKKQYAQKKGKLFANLGAKAPHILPRNLYLIGGKDKRTYIDSHGQSGQLSLLDNSCSENALYVARNQRLNRDDIFTYTTFDSDAPATIVEFPHRFIDFLDFAGRTGQTQYDVLCADLKVDDWYFNRYIAWGERIDETCTSLQQ